MNNRQTLKSIVFTMVTALAMFIAFVLISVYAPEEKSMGVIQKIFYLHVPLAWVTVLAFLVIFVCSILYLAKGNVLYDNIARSSAKIGFIFNSLMLITGSIWAKAVWGVWWTWDPRLTTSLILWFIYICYLLVRNSNYEEERGAKFASVIGIIGFADIPVIALSTTLWQTLHPSEMIFQGGLTVPMLLTLIICVIAFTLFYVRLMTITIAIHRMEGVVSEMKISNNLEQGED